MLKSLLVKDHMVGDQLAFRPETDVLQAVHLLLKHRLSGAPVADSEGRLIGFLSEKDCLKVALSSTYFDGQAGTVAEHMTREVVTLSGESSMIEAIQLFITRAYRCLPVVEGERLVGQLSRHDMLKALETLRRR
ncbi:MAG: CBS domain-containing protein [Thauera phenolivorans]|uniref:CBS domain-containing protein n=1 Tax=Thauera phenolivorans TaxID=1792543 RepID=A0A7X7LVB7_9RHOO|nr:CBS domain-containing protein [Thauera phenolivorans]NLF53874.1 CBS domain-containing protein [Thauera phenolivorans]